MVGDVSESMYEGKVFTQQRWAWAVQPASHPGNLLRCTTPAGPRDVEVVIRSFSYQP